MKLSFGFTRLWPSVGTIAFMIGSFALLAALLIVSGIVLMKLSSSA